MATPDRPLTYPTVHLNGSSGASLKADLEAAYVALGAAVDALCKCAPHGRDYYVEGPDAWPRARDQHDARIERVRQIQSEVTQIWEAVEAQVEERESFRRAWTRKAAGEEGGE